MPAGTPFSKILEMIATVEVLLQQVNELSTSVRNLTERVSLLERAARRDAASDRDRG